MARKTSTNRGTGRAALPAADRYFSRAVGNALRILEALQMSDKPLTLSALVKLMALPKSSVFRMLRTLEITGYIRRIEEDRFSAVQGAGSVAHRRVSRMLQAAEEPMKSLSREFRETISLALLFENRIEVIVVIDSPHRVSMGNAVGDIIPPHASSLGKCIAAWQPEDRQARLLRIFGLVAFTPQTIVAEPVLNQEFIKVRAQGYASDMDESVLGGCCLSAPILGPNRQVIGAISISAPKVRYINEKRLIAAIKGAAATVSKALGEDL